MYAAISRLLSGDLPAEGRQICKALLDAIDLEGRAVDATVAGRISIERAIVH
jgi:hypothetical protein